jgi:hypothetical protein
MTTKIKFLEVKDRLSTIYILLLHCVFFYPLWHFDPMVGHGLPLRGLATTHSLDTPHSVELLWTVISPTQRPLVDNTQHSRETNIHAPFRYSNPQYPNKPAAADPRLRPLGRWDRHSVRYTQNKYTHSVYIYIVQWSEKVTSKGCKVREW